MHRSHLVDHRVATKNNNPSNNLEVKIFNLTPCCYLSSFLLHMILYDIYSMP